MFAWYPFPFRQFGNSGNFAIMLILAAGLAGPAMTWVVFVKGKRGLKFDLWIIAFVQLAAIAWGTLSLYQNRPYWMVFTLDRFEVLSTRDVDTSWINDPKFLDKPLSGPLLLYANMPDNPADYQKLVHEVMFEGKPDLQFRPESWSLYNERTQQVAQASRPISALREARPGSADAIDGLIKSHGNEIDQLKFAPVLSKHGQFAAILDAESGEVIDNLMIDPFF